MPFPVTQQAIKDLLLLWQARLVNYKTQYGLTDTQVDQQSDDADIYSHLLTARHQLDEDVGEFSTYFSNMTTGNPNLPAANYPTVELNPLPAVKIGVKPGIVSRNKELYNYLKRHPNRTAESLADLGITDVPKNDVLPENKKPLISGNALPDDKVSLTFSKQGMKAIRFQMRRGGDWNTSGDPTNSPFIDTTGSIDSKPEKREYRAIYLEKNEPVGQYSDIITIYTTP